jgi:hypothetical protein
MILAIEPLDRGEFKLNRCNFRGSARPPDLP